MSPLQSFILLTILTAQCLATDKPTITPAGPTIEITAGHPLEITCKSMKEIKFLKPPPREIGGIKSTEQHEESAGIGPGTWTWTMHKPTTTIADAGFYGCANNDVTVDETKHDQPDVTWLEVIVSNL